MPPAAPRWLIVKMSAAYAIPNHLINLRWHFRLNSAVSACHLSYATTYRILIPIKGFFCSVAEEIGDACYIVLRQIAQINLATLFHATAT